LGMCTHTATSTHGRTSRRAAPTQSKYERTSHSRPVGSISGYSTPRVYPYCRGVIDDPVPWKDELVKAADRLEAKTRQTRWTRRTDYLIERDFVVSAYTMRKLIESHNVSDELRLRAFPVKRFELTGEPPDLLDPDITASYDLDNGRRRTLSASDLCHEIVHSFVFTFFCGETTDLFDGVFVSSDRDRYDYVYLVLASDFIALCCDFGTEDV
jgi:hypothetical protein